MNIETISYLTAAVGFSALTVVMLRNIKRQPQKAMLALACLASAAWAGAVAAYSSHDFSRAIPQGLESIRALAWFGFLLLVLYADHDAPAQGSARFRVAFGGVAAFVLGLTLLALYRVSGGSAFPLVTDNAILAGHMLISLGGLVMAEQIFRQSQQDQRPILKCFCAAVGGMFAYDFYLYSDALLVHEVDSALWSARGFVHAIGVLIIARALANGLQWTTVKSRSVDLTFSRQMVFRSTALLAAGVYLLVMGAGGYIVRIYGGSWGGVAQATFLFGALVIFVILFFSEQVRAKLRVLISKHFFYYKYDHRQEWLRFIRTLSSDGETKLLQQRVIRAIAQIVESTGGVLWRLHNESYVPTASTNGPDFGDACEPLDGDLARFLRERGWILERQEWLYHPARYDGVPIPDWLWRQPEAWLIVPLIYHNGLMGFVVLNRPRTPMALNWEDRDLLKTVATQTASYLAEEEATEALSQAQQFEAFSKLSAFVVHDLKNSVSQLSMLARNAAKHKRDPKFVDDAVHTIENTVSRMNTLMAQLRGVSGSNAASPVDLLEAVREAVEANMESVPVPDVVQEGGSFRIMADPERLHAVFSHLIQNAQEATPPDGEVKVRVTRTLQRITVDIRDTGCGMDPAFVRERL
nr:PEP-CTERM system histidine kinase PrsK [Gammaproteobacteria bacterium]NIU03056.1 PEP-CTERM system histidine kinase PrsK [Gammaproteobacteria bacterium]NIV50576.1 PEP-CTERM system histidine kinase PrsK [Gammaproteobacteria bacterium]NIX84331.1 PEP-CTERM system histidine kinase PrsK [Gammaproteobacteria bacterium]